MNKNLIYQVFCELKNMDLEKLDIMVSNEYKHIFGKTAYGKYFYIVFSSYKNIDNKLILKLNIQFEDEKNVSTVEFFDYHTVKQEDIIKFISEVFARKIADMIDFI